VIFFVAEYVRVPSPFLLWKGTAAFHDNCLEQTVPLYFKRDPGTDYWSGIDRWLTADAKYRSPVGRADGRVFFFTTGKVCDNPD